MRIPLRTVCEIDIHGYVHDVFYPDSLFIRNKFYRIVIEKTGFGDFVLLNC